LTNSILQRELSPLDQVSLDIGRVHGQKQYSAVDLLRNWDSVVCECEQSSILSVYDYINDLYVRDYVQWLLDSETAKACDDYGWWSARIAEIDSRMKSQFRSDVEVGEQSVWWRQGVLRAGGPQYEEQFEDVLLVRRR